MQPFLARVRTADFVTPELSVNELAALSSDVLAVWRPRVLGGTVIDLDPVLDALAETEAWSSAQALATMTTMAADGSAAVDWDGFAGESWGRLLIGDTVAAIVWMHRPFVLVAEEHAATMTGVLGRAATVIAVPALDAQVLAADRRQLAEIFGPGASSAAIDPAAFSADELWFATV